MPYSQYNTIKSVKKNLGVSVEVRPLFSEVEPIAPTAWLEETLSKAMSYKIAFFSEKSRSEALVFPVLLETYARTDNAFTLYSGAIMDADREKGLNGECDFVLGLGKQAIELEAPIFCIVEAKDNDIELGIPQCIAQLMGASIVNLEDGLDYPVIFGAVTTGDTWQFLKLTNQKEVVLDNKFFYLEKLDALLGILKKIVESNTKT